MNTRKTPNQPWQRSHAQWEAIVQAAPDAILIADETSHVVFANQKAHRLFGYSTYTLVGIELRCLMPERYRDAHHNGMQRFMQSGESRLMGHTIKMEGLRYDQSVFPLELSLSYWQEDDTHFFYGIIRDITQQKEQEKALQNANAELNAALEEIQTTKEQLLRLNEELEQRVASRTTRLEEQKAELHHLLKQIPAVIGILKGREGRVVLANDTFRQFWGPRLAPGKTMREIWPELEGQGHFALIEQVYDTGEVISKRAYPGYVRRPQTDITDLVYFDLVFVPHRNLAGAIDGVIMYGVEVTEHVQAQSQLGILNRALAEKNEALAANEEELRQTLDNTIELNQALQNQETFLSSIIDQTPVSTWIADAEGTQIRVNDACLKLFGVEDADLVVGKYNILKDEALISRLFYPDIQAVFTEGKAAQLDVPYDVSEVKHIQVPTGQSIYLHTTIFPIKNTTGKITHAVIQHEDITERVQYEQALQASEEQLRLITDALPVLIAYITADLRYKFVSKAYCAWFGKPKEEIEGKLVWEVIGDSAYEQVKEVLHQTLAGEEIRFERHMHYQDAGVRDTMAHLVPHKVEGKTRGVISIVTDISILKKAQTELQEKNEELQRANDDLDSFVYIASHDLKTPIANIEGLTGILRARLSEKIGEFEHEVLTKVEQSIAKFKLTIVDLTEVSRIQKNMEALEEEISFATILNEIKDDIYPLVSESEAIIQEDIQVESVYFTRYLLKSILQNLLTNAIKYRSPKRSPKVQVRVFKAQDFVVLQVQDNGLGLTPAQQAKVFEMFQRLHTHTEGTGVGLYIVKRIVESRGGVIELDSTVDQGTTFTIRLKNMPAA